MILMEQWPWAAHRGYNTAINYNTGLTNAASGGHESIVRLLLKLGANDFNVAMVRAGLRGHQNIVVLIRERMDSPSSKFLKHHLTYIC